MLEGYNDYVIINELSRNSNHDESYDILIGNNPELTELKSSC